MKLTTVMKQTLNGRFLALSKANVPPGFRSAYTSNVAHTLIQRPPRKPVVHKIPKKG